MNVDESCYRCLLIALFMTFTIVRGYHVLKTRKLHKHSEPTQESGFSRALRFLAFLGLLLSIVAYTLVLIMEVPYIDDFAFVLSDLVRWMGMGLGVLGIMVLHTVHSVLGRHFSAELELNKEHTLITHGPYASIRHPMYTCLFMVFIGGALVSGNGLIAGFALANILILIWRVQREEEMMRARFGDAYQAYAARTSRFVPGL